MNKRQEKLLETFIRKKVRKFLNENSRYKISDFEIGDKIEFKDGEIWKVVKSGTLSSSGNIRKSNTISIKPNNELAKSKNISLAISYEILDSDKNIKRLIKNNQ